MDEGQIQEAAYTVFQSVGFSSYLHGVGYSLDQFLEELKATVAHLEGHGGDG